MTTLCLCVCVAESVDDNNGDVFRHCQLTLHVLTVDTGRVEAIALITRTFISQARGMVPPQTPDTQVKACHFFFGILAFLFSSETKKGSYENLFIDKLC